ncbi:hypothetical protein B6S12_06375 [Helicobacter valdiviensis]|uniref:Uncharacterized protein n=1 Tax=Helicobacter valdiviensis TaxID=1458358 RepID=A0A2W6MXL3_9HELI|nr:hypothetical protein [Helicobacter valdiviensis]PZT47938.1 hypothetical protein B6S12_06375 [Helicobacter valdiviensis]
MNINNQNAGMFGLLSQAYDNQYNNKDNNISGYPKQNSGNSSFNIEETSSINETSSLFSTQGTFFNPSLIQDTFESSNELAKIQSFASSFEAEIKNPNNTQKLGEAMYENGILNKQEKIGFDLLQKLNPSLDSNITNELIQNSNLNSENAKLLSNVDKKIGAVRYFGGF